MTAKGRKKFDTIRTTAAIGKPVCPRCGHRVGYEEQSGPMPPSVHCIACGYRDFDMKGFRHRAAE